MTFFNTKRYFELVKGDENILKEYITDIQIIFYRLGRYSLKEGDVFVGLSRNLFLLHLAEKHVTTPKRDWEEGA